MNGYAPWVLIAAGGLITHQPHWLEQLYPANIEQTESLPAYLLHEPVWGAICRAVHPKD
jgi:hypothetical protein